MEIVHLLNRERDVKLFASVHVLTFPSTHAYIKETQHVREGHASACVCVVVHCLARACVCDWGVCREGSEHLHI